MALEDAVLLAMELRDHGRVVRDAMLRLVFRFAVTDGSTAWMYDHRITWDEPLPMG
jgi:hypothetical protein